MELTHRIKKAIAGLIDTGAHLDAAETTAEIAKRLGLSERFINYTHIEVRNRLAEYGFKRVPFGERMVFLPQCLRSTANCKAEMGDEGWVCKNCGACRIPEIQRIAAELGYKKVFVVPGGSMVESIMNKYRPRAVVGVSCFHEMGMVMGRLKGSGVAPQGVLLLREGCKDTDVNLEELREKLGAIDKEAARLDAAAKPAT